MQHLSDVLFPVKNAILAVEATHATLADAYMNLMKIAAAIHNLSTDEYKGFRNHCVKKFDYRFEEFNDPAYQLAFFLHPAYKGAGLKYGTFPLIANYAAQLWQKMGKSKKSCENLITQLRYYKEQERMINGRFNPYVAPYTIGKDTPLLWWNSCEVKPNYLQRLAIKLFSITPSSAACERVFSSLGWLYGKRRTQLGMDRLEGLAKIYRFNLSNAAEQLHRTEMTCEMMKNVAETVFNEFEKEVSLEESENAEFPNPTEHLYINELDLNLNVSDIVDLRSPIFHPNHGIHLNVNNSEEEDESSENELSDEDYEYDVSEIITSRLEGMQL
jgi:hypothetical protein